MKSCGVIRTINIGVAGVAVHILRVRQVLHVIEITITGMYMSMRSVLQVKHLSFVYLGCVYLSIKLLNNQFLSFHNHVVSLFSVDFIFI